jgi:hypothetical protein
MRFVDVVFGSVLLYSVAADKCVAPANTDIGCFDIETALDDGGNAILSSLDPKVQTTIKKAQPLIKFAVDAAKKKVDKTLFQTGFCIQQNTGDNILSGKTPTGTKNNQVDYACKTLPLDPGTSYMIFAVGISTDILKPLCPASVNANEMATICLAFTSCGGLPTASLVVNEPLLSCMSGTYSSLAGSAGLSGAVSLATKYGLDHIMAGESLTRNLNLPMKLWNFDTVGDYQIRGHWMDQIEMAIDPLNDLLGIPKDVMSFRGTQTRIIGFGTVVSDNVINTVKAKLQDRPATALTEGDIPEFLIGSVVNVEVSINLSKLIGKGLPSINNFLLANVNQLATTFKKENIGLDRGLYFYLETGDVAKTVATTILDWIQGSVGGIFDKILPPGMRISDFKNNIQNMEAHGFKFGINLTQQQFGVMVTVPLIGLVDGVAAACKIDLVSGAKFSCQVKVADLDYYITAVKDQAVWVARQAESFFDEKGAVIAAVAEDAFDKAGEWTQAAIAKTQDEIKKGYIKVSDEVTNFAETSVLPCVSFVADKAKCGTAIVTSASLCGFDVASDASKCGVDFVTDGAKCGTKLITDGVNCGVETVTDATRCGVDTVTDAGKCGVETITDGARCGSKMVTDGVLCGVDWVKTGAACIACFFSCDACKSPKTCSVANTCSVPKSCTQIRTCSAPKSCDVPNTCGIPRTCNIAKSCSVEKSCWVAGAGNCKGNVSGSGGNITPPPAGSTSSVNMELVMGKEVDVTDQVIADFKAAVAKHTGVAVEKVDVVISATKVRITIANLDSYTAAFVAQNSLNTSVKNGMFQKSLAQYSSLSTVSDVTVNADFKSVVEFSVPPSSESSGNPAGVAVGIIFGLGFVALAAYGFVSHRNGTLPGKLERLKGLVKLPAKDQNKSATELGGVKVVKNPMVPATGHWTNT